MHLLTSSLSTHSTLPIALYNSQQIYAMEQEWFAQGYDSFGLMQQAAWQMAQHIIQLYERKHQEAYNNGQVSYHDNRQPQAVIWVGHGNNGGDGWLIAHYLQQSGWQVQIITVGIDNFEHNSTINHDSETASQSIITSDAIKAQRMAFASECPYQRFEESVYQQVALNFEQIQDGYLNADVYIDALFGIGLDRAPTGMYKQAINAFNQSAKVCQALVVAVDIPSGLVASTGQVFEQLAIQADITLCLIARKFGLHTKDGMDYAGEVFDIPLIPYAPRKPSATLLSRADRLSVRRQNSYKGSYGHVLVIGGNRIDGSQGMGGAAILAASSAMATGAGKITVACHNAFHGALLTSLPDAMTIDLHDKDGVKNLIKEVSVIAIGMGLGRDELAKTLFITYLQAAMEQSSAIVIDADGLYHLASLQAENHQLVFELHKYCENHQVCLTPHSGEAAKLLNIDIMAVEANRLESITQCADIYGGHWVLKGAGSLVLEQGEMYVCGVGNAGMATAGMGDILSGVIAGLLAQQDLNDAKGRLCQAVLIHGLAGDTLVNLQQWMSNGNLLIGQRGLQAQDMPVAIRNVMQQLICPS